MTDDEKQCPQCAEAVKKQAAICRFCQYDFTLASAPQPEKVSSVVVNAGPRRNSFESCLGCIGLIVLFVLIFGTGQRSTGPEDDAPNQEATSVDKPPTRPVLVEAGLDIVPEIAKAGPPWDGPVVDQSGNYSGEPINLQRKTVVLSGGMIEVDRAEGGGIYRVRVQAGLADRCGQPAAVEAAFVELTRALNLPIANPNQASKLQSIWTSKTTGFEDLALGNVQVGASGGCLPWVSVKPL